MKHTFSRRARPFLLVAIAATVVGCADSTPPPPPPPPVEVAAVLVRDVPIFIENIGQTLGSTEVEVRARTEGFLETVDFREGSFVKAGDLLYTIDRRPLEAALAKARAQTASARADLARAKQDVDRYRPLVAQRAIPQQQYDTSVAVERASSAAVDAAAAAEESATIDLEYATIRSPIDGLVGKTEVKPGNLVGRGQNTLLTTISTIDPIDVRFTVSEQEYLDYARSGEGRSGGVGKVNVELVLADGSVLPQRGHILFADRTVDAATGTLLLQAEFPNPDRLVRPGQYARIRVSISVRQGAILIPQRAVKEMQATFSVAVVSADNKVSMRSVTPGERVGTLWVISKGLAAGDRVVVEGLQKVRNGVTVTPTVVEISDADLRPSAVIPGPGGQPSVADSAKNAAAPSVAAPE